MIIVRIIGGLGNQMFQYAFYKNLSDRYTNVKCDILGFKRYNLHTGFELEKVFNVKLNKASINEIAKLTDIHSSNVFSKVRRKVIGRKATHIVEKDFYWDLLKDGNDYYFDGYWQSEFFLGDKNKLRETDFQFKDKLDSENVKIAEFVTSCNSISVHFRRGDYVGHSFYSQLNEVYYKKSINIINDKIKSPVFFIFSDEITWVKENLNTIFPSNVKIVFVDGNSNKPSVDLRLMSLCKHNITANSSFSWWGAWLNRYEDKIVIAPKKWYTNKIRNSLKMNQIPKTWIKI